MIKKIREFFSQKGQGVVEYALILGFVAVIAVSLINTGGLQDSLEETIEYVKEILKSARL